MSIPDRKEIVRVDCPDCNGNGYVEMHQEQRPCHACGGVGMREKSVPWRQEGYTVQEAGNILGVRNPTNRLLKGDAALERGASNEEE